MNVRRGIVAILLLCGLVASAAPEYRLKLRASGYTGTMALTNFPVLVRISTERLPDFSYDDCVSGSSDISFALEDGTVLPHDVDTWDATGESLVWVSVPVFRDGQAFYLRWKDSSPQTSRATEVWTKAHYAGVWHLNEASGNGADATGNGCAAVPTGKTAATSCIRATSDSPVGPARQLAASNGTGANTAYLKMADFDNDTFANDFTISFWANKTTTYESKWFANRGSTEGGSGVAGFGFGTIYWAGSKNAYSGRGYGYNGSSCTLNQGVVLPVDAGWQHWSFAFSGTSMTWYQKGSSILSGTISRDANGSLATTLGFAFGSSTTGADKAFVGQVDELRISTDRKSSDWALAEHQTGTLSSFVTSAGARETMKDRVLVTSDIAEFTSSDIPAYGFQNMTAGETRTFSAPATGSVQEGRVTATCAGWKLLRSSDGAVLRTSATTTVAGEDTTTCKVTYAEPVQLVWLWKDVTESEGPITYYVSPSGDNTDGLSWQTAFTHPQTAVDRAAGTAERPATILVGAGTYKATSGVSPYAALHIDRSYVTVKGVDGRDVTFLDGTTYENSSTSLAYKPLAINASLSDVFVANMTLVNGRRKNGSNDNDTWLLATSIAADSGTMSNLNVRIYSRNRVIPVRLTGSARLLWSTVTAVSTVDNNPYPNQFQNHAVKLTGSALVDHCIIRDIGPLVSSGGVTQGWVQPVAVESATAILRNTLVTGCTVGATGDSMSQGGGIVYATAGTIESCTIAGNRCYGGPGGLYLAAAGVVCRNSIVYGNASDTDYADLNGVSGAAATITYTCSTGVTSDETTHNVNADPSFTDAENGDYRPTIKSVVAGKGWVNTDWMTADAVDLAGVRRVWTDSTVTPGCYEPQGRSLAILGDFAYAGDRASGAAPFAVTFVPTVSGTDGTETYSWTFGDGGTSTEKSPTHTFSAVGVYDVSLTVSQTGRESLVVTKQKYITAVGEACYVKEDAEGTSPYDTWEKATSNLAAVVALRPARIVVTNGTYIVPAPNGLELDWAVTVESVEGRETTTLDTGYAKPAGATGAWFSGVKRMLMTVSAAAVVRGFRLVRSCNQAISITGGGTLENCRFDNYHGSAKAISVYGANATLSHCVFDFCRTYVGDANIKDNANAIRLVGASLMDGCIVSNYYCHQTGNCADGSSWGVVRLGDSAKMRNSYLTANDFACSGSDHVSAILSAAAVMVTGTDNEVSHCTIVGNLAADSLGTAGNNVLGGGIYVGGTDATVANNILWSNEVNGVAGNVAAPKSPALFANNLVDVAADLPTGATSCLVGLDPLLKASDYHLTPRSPCLEAGRILTWCAKRGMATDIDGQERRCGRPEIGCHESQIDPGFVFLVR